MPTIDEVLGKINKNRGDKFAEYLTKSMIKDIAKLGYEKNYRESYKKEHGVEYAGSVPPGCLDLEGVLAITTMSMMVNFDQRYYDSIKDITLDDLERTEFPKVEEEYQKLMKKGEKALDEVGGWKILEVLMKYHICKKALEYF